MPDIQTRIQQWLLHRPLLLAMGLSLGTIIGTSLVRFSYALFVPAMRADLGWSYLLSGAIDTLPCRRLFDRCNQFVNGDQTVFLLGARLWWRRFIQCFLGMCAWSRTLLRSACCGFLSGFTSASVFAGGTVLIAQLAAQHPARSGTLLGIYYAGGGLGMVLCAVLVPWSMYIGEQAQWMHAWQVGWLAVGATGLLFTLLMWQPAKAVPAPQHRSSAADRTAVSNYVFMLAGYFCFGMGYIGYMTFVITLLRELHWLAWQTGLFYAAMGMCGMFSVQLWSGALDKYQGGECLAQVNSLLALACVIPATLALSGVVIHGWYTLAIYASGMLFGGCFATAVASTTAFIKHNLPSTQWVAVITVFTSVFAVGQVFGPSLTGWISDHAGGLPGGLLFSAVILLSGAMLAWLQTPLGDAGKIRA